MISFYQFLIVINNQIPQTNSMAVLALWRQEDWVNESPQRKLPHLSPMYALRAYSDVQYSQHTRQTCIQA